jgi:RimJ/RimL family protein N-acetyltransferase
MPIILETDRLLLRTWKPDDEQAIFAIYSNPEVTRFLGNGAPDKTIADAQERLRRGIARQEQTGLALWAMIEKKSGELVGSCGLKHLEDGLQIEVGYHLARPAWNRGYATEAAGACLRHGFEILQLNRIVGVVALDNFASQRVLEKIGMRLEGRGYHYQREVFVYAADRLMHFV